LASAEGDPYLPVRRCWVSFPGQALVVYGPDLIDVVVPGETLVTNVAVNAHGTKELGCVSERFLVA
jgi:hypothetical protein